MTNISASRLLVKEIQYTIHSGGSYVGANWWFSYSSQLCKDKCGSVGEEVAVWAWVWLVMRALG